jgi:hypothetical protein
MAEQSLETFSDQWTRRLLNYRSTMAEPLLNCSQLVFASTKLTGCAGGNAVRELRLYPARAAPSRRRGTFD